MVLHVMGALTLSRTRRKHELGYHLKLEGWQNDPGTRTGPEPTPLQ